MQSGTRNTKNWLLEFDTLNTGINPLMGWESSKDTMSEVKLEFSTKEQAINNAKKNDIDYYVIEPQKRKIIKKSYSDNFLKRINPNKIGDFIQAENPGMSIRAAAAMALAVIYSTYLQLVFEEEGERVPTDILEKFEKNDHESFMWAPPKTTLH